MAILRVKYLYDDEFGRATYQGVDFQLNCKMEPYSITRKQYKMVDGLMYFAYNGEPECPIRRDIMVEVVE